MKTTENLLLRRKEIVNIVRDHPYCSMDFIARRFPRVSKRMIQKDVKKLIEKDLIIRSGKTRGAVYSVRIG